jgi:hypothetical protein
MELLKRISLSVFVIAIVLLAVIMGGLRLAIMNIDFFKSEIEYLLERDLAPGFVFTGLSGDLNRFNPILRIENVSITLPDRSQPLFIDSLEVEIDFWASWRENALVVLEVTGQLEKLELVKDKAGNWSTNDLSRVQAGSRANTALPEFEPQPFDHSRSTDRDHPSTGSYSCPYKPPARPVFRQDQRCPARATGARNPDKIGHRPGAQPDLPELIEPEAGSGGRAVRSRCLGFAAGRAGWGSMDKHVRVPGVGGQR